MGTNYYHRTNICSECGRYDELHIGKASWGWQFNFHGCRKYEGYNDFEIISFKQWKDILTEGEIWSDEGDQITIADFLYLVKSKRTDQHHHAKEYPSDNTWTDAEGYSFSGYEFS
jgi:hypothetical protein